MFEGEIITSGWNYSPDVGKRNTTVSSVVWSIVDSDSSATLGSETTSSVESYLNITAVSTGSAIVKAVATFASGEVSIDFFRVNIQERPEFAPPDRYTTRRFN